MDEYVGIVFVDFDFFKNDSTFALNVVGGESGVEHQVCQHVEGNRHVVGKGFDVKADGFLTSEGVKVAADGVHLAGDELGRARACALEHHVLHKVRDSVG